MWYLTFNMAFIVTKKIKNKEYLYLVESIREKNTIIKKTVKYIGKKRPIPEEELACMNYSYDKKDWVLDKFEDTLSYQHHVLLKKASDNQKEYLTLLDSMSKEKQKEKFLSVFISNSNSIEGSTLSVRETHNYLFNDILPEGKSKKELFMADNLLKAWNYVEKNHERFPTEDDLKKLHALININIEDDSTLGKYKSVQNYIGDVLTTSYLFTDERMSELINWIKLGFKKMDDFEVIFQSHAQFEIIHPFVDGNGRVGRLLMNWLLLYKKLSPIAIPSKKRLKYISALENSRRGKIEAVVKFCSEVYLEQYKFS